ncbi:MAG: NAD(P)(+) transhydrogenase (Re/Si-specific) subunit alpha [Alphaproteobacteria bacterium]|jgi:NAD(P) transhydrogenase subunit alpha|nr:NAD(P)(+) transhydrogenase (Re/Si-specific) subunit alpha [Alphaproteobacteria bacterium]PPR14320.1 MAG: NAD(P) transhydrogenase subunit alpha part 1 [Alphaproteobacteria bacterium MarineAlpha12_Bin1]|tara:strand:+ start:19693 stop:20904 length:1212 start_codon:yes stop_codon:yes gene_type:complete
MKIAIPLERRAHERRVAATPDTVKRFISMGVEVSVESGAGEKASILDNDYVVAGATIHKTRVETFKGADIILKVQRPRTTSDGGADGLGDYPDGCILVALHNPFGDPIGVEHYAAKNIVSFAMEFLPRISRAQSMDALSSQANLAGYKAVVDAAAEYGRGIPMMMTAAGRINPAKVFVMGAGVAGLQAIATARRIGAVVSATDVRAVAKEEVESLGATFVMVESENDDSGQTEGGYAKEMSDDYKRRQAELIATHISGQDIVITTALIPGRTAPVLINDEMIASMKAGSVILDLAVEQGGNVTRSVGDKIITTENGVVIMGHFNLPSRLASDASALYARNLYNFVELMIDKETQQLEIDWDDEIISSSCLTRDGKIIHPALLEEKKELDLSDPGSVKPQQEGV